jgi:hypothetical protein
MKFSHRARAWLAYIRSFFKKNWQLCDYPIHYMPQTHTGPDTPERLRVLPWRADILAGISQAWETLEKRHTPILNQSSPPHEKIGPSCLDLVDRFPSRSHQPKEFPSIPISAITLSTKFWHTNGQFLSDESSLWDFHEETDNTALIRKIGVVYGVDVSHISSANIVEILEEITNQIGQFPEDPILKAIRLDREARGCHVAGLPEQPWNTTSE